MFNEIIQRIQKRRAIRSYVERLGSALIQQYGASRYYAPEQVIATVELSELSWTWIGYALCMYCKRSSFTQYYASLGKTYDYLAMQGEVAAQFAQHKAASRRGKATGVTNGSAVDGAVISSATGWSDSGGYGHSYGGSDGGCSHDGGFDGGGSCDAGGY